ncbi:MAG: TolC family protein [Ignavibacteria bacterium]|nr:TolC family protein [Ignavibacteria bacterium]
MNIILLVSLIFTGGAGDTLDLNTCYEIADVNYPVKKQSGLYSEMAEKKIDNIGINYLPKITLKGQATYQSDVTRLDIENPFFKVPEVGKDMYKLTVDVNQLIYDGGSTSALKNIERSQLLVEKQKVEVELFTLKQRINDLYFNILILQEKVKSNLLLQEDIKNKMKEIESKIRNGLIPAGNIYILEAQLLQVEQELISIETDKEGAISMLSELLGEDISSDNYFRIPDALITESGYTDINRPEYKLFDLQKDHYKNYSTLADIKNMPRVSVFGQGGYGKPGLNMLDDKFKLFGLIGLSVQWSPFDWNSSGLDKQIYEINQNIIETQKETFDKNLRVSLEKYYSDIKKYEDIIIKDDEIISKRKDIVTLTSSQLDNGTITATTYLTELTNLNQSELMKQIHRLQLLHSKINLITVKGK